VTVTDVGMVLASRGRDGQAKDHQQREHWHITQIPQRNFQIRQNIFSA